jgi:hypothetical protein
VVNNDPILWAMLNAIKEHQGLIDKQENQIKLQQARIASLASQVKIMQASHRASAKASRPQSRLARREDLNLVSEQTRAR